MVDKDKYPDFEYDYFCIEPPPPPAPPPPPPDLGGMKPADPPGPKDPDAVARAAIFIESCLFPYRDPNINRRVDETYSTFASWSIERAMAERVNCFKDKTNGCKAVQECLGLLFTPDEPAAPTGCANGVGMQRHVVGPEHVFDEWMNCAGVGLECYSIPYFMCGVPRLPCDYKTAIPYCTADSAPRECVDTDDGEGHFEYQRPSCMNFGLTCDASSGTALCTGTGPACDLEFDAYGDFYADFRGGIACEDTKTLRACVNGHEQLVDCTAQGQGFSCIGGSRPRCGLDFQCDEYQPWSRDFQVSTCDGSSVVLCNSGVRTTIDCKSLGFEGCDPGYGYCIPGAREL